MRYWKPWRRLLIKLSRHLPTCLEDRILDYLYPDDCVINFKD